MDGTGYETHDGNEQPRNQPPGGANDVAALTYIVSRYAEVEAQIKGLKFEQKELKDSAWEKCGKSPKAITQLAKESAWDAVKRERQRQLEEEIDAGRAALGLLADTPLGEAEMQRMEEERQAGAAPKRRGRPPGSKNKIKPASAQAVADDARAVRENGAA